MSEEKWQGRTWQPRWCRDCKLRGDHTEDCPQRCLECRLADNAHMPWCATGIKLMELDTIRDILREVRQ